MHEEDEHPDNPWFGKTAGRLGFGPLNWQGRAAIFLYVFLVVVAIFVYSQLGVTIFVIGFYTVVFALMVAMKSDIMKGWPPGS
jgi:hypothetical protein